MQFHHQYRISNFIIKKSSDCGNNNFQILLASIKCCVPSNETYHWKAIKKKKNLFTSDVSLIRGLTQYATFPVGNLIKEKRIRERKERTKIPVAPSPFIKVTLSTSIHHKCSQMGWVIFPEGLLVICKNSQLPSSVTSSVEHPPAPLTRALTSRFCCILACARAHPW